MTVTRDNRPVLAVELPVVTSPSPQPRSQPPLAKNRIHRRHAWILGLIAQPDGTLLGPAAAPEWPTRAPADADPSPDESGTGNE